MPVHSRKGLDIAKDIDSVNAAIAYTRHLVAANCQLSHIAAGELLPGREASVRPERRRQNPRLPRHLLVTPQMVRVR